VANNTHSYLLPQALSSETIRVCSRTSDGEEMRWIKGSWRRLHAGNFQMYPVPETLSKAITANESHGEGSQQTYKVPPVLLGVEPER
jgi:hypothetical protein